jgi:ferredoxin
MLTEPTQDQRAGPTGSGHRGGPPEARLRAALLAHYRDLSALRYDYPLVLVEGAAGGEFVRSLSGVMDGVLQETAPRGAGGERLRRHVLQLEARIRARVADGAQGSLAELWDLSARELRSESDPASADALEDCLSRARRALPVCGDVVDCTTEIAPGLLEHAWITVHEARVRGVLAEIDGLVAKLSDILKVDFLKSEEARSPQRLEQAVGTRHGAAFDFEAWSHLLNEASHEGRLPESRRRRIRWVLGVLESQRFFTLPGAAGEDGDRPAPYSFVFESCASAVEAFRERRAEMLEFVKAIAIAELEIANRYREPKHEEFFARFDETSLLPEDLAQFPSYLVRLRAKDCTAQEMAQILQLLSSGLPMKVLVQTDDILAEAPAGGGLASGAGSASLAAIAVALSDTYVLQSASSSLYQVRERIRDGLARAGPALFSIFSGSAEQAPELPAYLRAAIATQSRAFPTFSYDPAAGGDWTSRFRIEDNPQPEVDWPLDRLEYEDDALQRVSEDVAFTFVDFAAADRRYARHLSRVPRSDWNESLVPVWTYLELCEEEARDKTPYVLMVDEENVLQKLAVDRVLIRAARQCHEKWRRLQELCGVRDVRFQQRLEEERAAWEREREAQALPSVPETREAGELPDAAAEAGPSPAAAEPAPDPDEPCIETSRCTTCDECTKLNPKMFAYDDNKQAYIADLDAGTYRDLVEAAESCQVSIIHPGMPRDPQEPGLAELIDRARPFRASG